MSLNPFPSIGAFLKTQSRTTLFLAFFSAAGTAFHVVHRLDATWIGYVTTIMTFVLGHSVKEDVFAQKNGNANGNGGVTPPAST